MTIAGEYSYSLVKPQGAFYMKPSSSRKGHRVLVAFGLPGHFRSVTRGVGDQAQSDSWRPEVFLLCLSR